MTCFMNIVGIITLVVSIVSFIYAYFNTAYPQIECTTFSGRAKSYNAKITLRNIGDILTIIRVNDTKSYLNPSVPIQLQSKWKTDEEFTLWLDANFHGIPNDFEISLVIANNSNKMFLCRITKGTKNIDIKIQRKIFRYC